MSSIFSSPVIRTPVNLMARKLLMKSPWWAKMPEEIRETFSDNVPSVRAMFDMTKPAPPEVEDKIGRKFGNFVVIGYSNSKEHRIKSIKARPQPSWWIGDGWNTRKKAVVQFQRINIWYAQCSSCGVVLRMSNIVLNRALRRGFDPSVCRGHAQFDVLRPSVNTAPSPAQHATNSEPAG